MKLVKDLQIQISVNEVNITHTIVGIDKYGNPLLFFSDVFAEEIRYKMICVNKSTEGSAYAHKNAFPISPINKELNKALSYFLEKEYVKEIQVFNSWQEAMAWLIENCK